MGGRKPGFTRTEREKRKTPKGPPRVRSRPFRPAGLGKERREGKTTSHAGKKGEEGKPPSPGGAQWSGTKGLFLLPKRGGGTVKAASTIEKEGEKSSPEERGKKRKDALTKSREEVPQKEKKRWSFREGMKTNILLRQGGGRDPERESSSSRREGREKKKRISFRKGVKHHQKKRGKKSLFKKKREEEEKLSGKNERSAINDRIFKRNPPRKGKKKNGILFFVGKEKRPTSNGLQKEVSNPEKRGLTAPCAHPWYKGRTGRTFSPRQRKKKCEEEERLPIKNEKGNGPIPSAL